jgi:hypothetical protein
MGTRFHPSCRSVLHFSLSWHRQSARVWLLTQRRIKTINHERGNAYRFHNASHTVLGLDIRLLQADMPSCTVAHVRLHKAVRSHVLVEALMMGETRFSFSPGIDNEAQEAFVLEMDLPDQPVQQRLAGSISADGPRGSPLHAPDAS